MEDTEIIKETEDAEVLKKAKDRFKRSETFYKEQREKAVEDLEFLDGNHWPEEIKRERDEDGRPCLTINKLPVHLDQIVGSERQNRPQVKIRPLNNKSNLKKIELKDGMVRGIEIASRSNVIYDHALEHGAACGWGAWRVVTEYASDRSFRQVIRLKKIDNALSIFWDPLAKEYDRSDAKWCFIDYEMDREDFEEEYGDQASPWTGESTPNDWQNKNSVRLTEYWFKEPYTKKIYLTEDNRVVDDETIDKERDKIVDSREVEAYRVIWRLLAGDQVLQTREWPGKYIPIVMLWGKQLNINGKTIYRGIVRHAKDPQRLLDYWISAETEQVALAPKAPFLGTSDMFDGHEQQWDDSIRRNFSHLLYNADPRVPGAKPTREYPPQSSPGQYQQILLHDQNIRDCTGQDRASLGMVSNEKSGVAIQERKMEGDQANYAFIDNLGRSIEYSTRVILDLIPKIYDTQQLVLMGYPDGKTDYVEINTPNPDISSPEKILNDLSEDNGDEDIVVTIGPNYATKRLEAGSGMLGFIQAVPGAAAFIADLVAGNMDWPESENVKDRLRKGMVPPEILTQKEREEVAKDFPPPPQVAAPPPDPKLEIELAIAQMKLEQEKAKLEGIKLDNEIKQSQSKDFMKKTIAEIMSEGRTAQ